MIRKIPITITFFSIISCMISAQDHVAHIDLTASSTPEAHISREAKGTYRWTLPNGKPETIEIDLSRQSIKPLAYDEIRFDINPTISQSAIHTMLTGVPKSGELCSWYIKFKTKTNHWSEGRYSLKLDDDGTNRSKRQKFKDNLLILNHAPRILGYPGEPKKRDTLLRNYRLVKHIVSVDFKLIETQIRQRDQQVETIYKLHIENHSDQIQNIILNPDSKKNLKYFQVESPTKITLSPKEHKIVEARIYMNKELAMSLPTGYAESAIPEVRIPGVPDSDVVPLRGFRPFVMWGTVPIFFEKQWDPVVFQAFVSARKKMIPEIDSWCKRMIHQAAKAMLYDWPVPDFGPPAHDQRYRCDSGKCPGWLKPATPTSFHKHICPECGKVFENNSLIDCSWVTRYNGLRGKDINYLGWSWLITGERKYADKAVKILKDYAKGYDKMPISSARSTCGGSKLGAATLFSSYTLQKFAEGYDLLKNYPGMDTETKKLIERFILLEGIAVAQHSTEFTNMTAEHFHAYGVVGLTTGFWPLFAEAVHGDFGWHQMVEYAFSEDGVGHEGWGYHQSTFGAMNKLGIFAYRYGVNLFTARLKRVFDGTISIGKTSINYELAYRIYGDLNYVPVLKQQRAQGLVFPTVLYGEGGLPNVRNIKKKSELLTGSGYIFLRKGDAANWRQISLNYIKQFDRFECDRLTTFFFNNGRQVDSSVGRITYGSPHSHWMYDTAAHNTIVVDGQSQQRTPGRLIAYQPNEKHPAAVVGSDPKRPFFPKVNQLRTIALIEDAYIVLDQVNTTTPRTIDRYQYGRGEATFKTPLRKVDDNLEFLPKEGDFHDLMSVGPTQKLELEFANHLKMKLVSDKPMTCYKALTMGGYQASPMEVTFSRINDTQRATFLGAFTYGKDKIPPTPKLISSTPKEIVFELMFHKNTYQVIIKLDIKDSTNQMIKIIRKE